MNCVLRLSRVYSLGSGRVFRVSVGCSNFVSELSLFEKIGSGLDPRCAVSLRVGLGQGMVQ